jgi:hypothetical protein
VHDLAGGHYRRKRPFSFRSREIYERRKNEINPRSESIQLFSLGALVTVDHAQFLANADAIAEQSFLFRSREIYEIGKRPINQ